MKNEKATNGVKSPESEHWRSSQIKTLYDILEENLQPSGDGFEIEVKDIYFPNIGEGYQVRGDAKSQEVGSYSVIWRPLKKELERWAIYIRPEYQGEGIGSSLNAITEQIARDLGCNRLVMKGIVDTSLEYWRNREGYVVQGGRATKILE